jgi:MATE family multidrug resistance protein
MTQGARFKEILKVAWPLIVANSFWNLQLTIDRIFLGILSTEALGAAMAVMGVFWVPMALLQQTASYVMTFVAQYVGAGEKDKIGSSLWQALYVSIIGGVLFIFQNFFSQSFFEFVGHPIVTQKLEVEYFNSLSYSALPAAVVAAISGFFTGLGQTKTVIGINLVGLVLNAIFDYLIIFGNLGFPSMGIAGAGYATAIANFGAAFYGFYLIYNQTYENEFKIKTQKSFNFSMIKQFLRFGLPSGLQWALEGLAFTTFLIILGNYTNGEAVLASSSIAMTVMMISVLPSMGVAQAVMMTVGQALGEKNPTKAETATYDGVKLSLIYMGLVAMSFYLFPEFYLSWFQNSENINLWNEVSIVAPVILKIVAIFTLFDSMYLNISFALKGAGDTKFVSILSLLVPWPLMVLPAYLFKDSANAVFYAWSFVAVFAITITIFLYLRFKGGKWKTMSVIHPI